MRKNLGSRAAIFPMPVLMIGTYDQDGKVDVMNAAWGMMVETNKIALNLSANHKTVKNIKDIGYFTVGLADVEHMKEADYVGIVSLNDVFDKFEKSRLTAVKSEYVNAPIINEFPVTMECKFIEYQDDMNGVGVIGEIINVSADETVLDENGNVDVGKINALVYDPFNHGYYSVGERVGTAFKEGQSLK